jgi:hypothetical protein
LQATRFDNNPSAAVYAARAAIYAKKGSGISLDFFKNEKAKSLPVDYLEEFASSLALFLSKQDAVTQQKGLDLLKSDFYLKGPLPQYRRFYIITGLVSRYNQEFNATFKEKLKATINSIYQQEEDSYLKEVLRESFGDLFDN